MLRAKNKNEAARSAAAVQRQSYKFRLEPTERQNKRLFECLNLCQDVYNAAIEERYNAYQKWKELGKPDQWESWPSRSSQQTELKEVKKLEGMEDYKTLIHSQPLQEVLKRVNLAYQKFFADLKKGEVNPPKFKGKGRYKSFTFTQYGPACHLNNNQLHLSKIGALKIRLSRKIEGTIKTVNIKFEHGHWVAIFSCEDVPQEEREVSSQKIAIDYGLEHIASFSNGDVIEQPRFLKDLQTHLRLEQRKLSKKKKSGKNRRKQRIQVAKIHSKIERKRSDFQFKESKKIVDQFGQIAFEEHSLQFMVKNKHLAQSTADRAIGSFKQKLARGRPPAQAQKAGRELVEISTTDQGIGNSQKCLCGHVGKKKLSQRVHDCPSCGIRVSRDHMASSIIYQRAFDTAPSWYQSAVGQTVKSPVRAMLAATQRGSTLLNVDNNKEKGTPDDPETSWIPETEEQQGCESYPVRQNSDQTVSRNL